MNNGDEEQRYRITYRIDRHPEGVPKSEVDPKERGGTDCLVLLSILGRPGGPGPANYAQISMDGFTGDDLTPPQMYQAWAMWAHMLMEHFDENDPRHATLSEAHRRTREMVGVLRLIRGLDGPGI